MPKFPFYVHEQLGFLSPSCHALDEGLIRLQQFRICKINGNLVAEKCELSIASVKHFKIELPRNPDRDPTDGSVGVVVRHHPWMCNWLSRSSASVTLAWLASIRRDSSHEAMIAVLSGSLVLSLVSPVLKV